MIAFLGRTPVTRLPELPECHALRESPMGYSATSVACPNCRDKISCLPASIAKNLGPLSLEADQEVFAFSQGTIDYAIVIKRMLLRHSLGAAPVPKSLQHTTPILASLGEGKRTPRSGTISQETMLAYLRGGHGYRDLGVRIGQTVALRVGMHLVRRKKNAVARVLLRSDGFEADGICYPSLTAAAVALDKRNASGNDFFHLRRSNVEIWDEHGVVIERGGARARRS